MLKALQRILWLTRLYQIKWKFVKTTKECHAKQVGVIIPIFKKDDCKQRTNYTIAKVGAGLGLGLRFSRLPGIIKLSEICVLPVTASKTTSLMKI